MKINWEYDKIKLKDGSPSSHILYGDKEFIISTAPNRLLSDNLETLDPGQEVTMLYQDSENVKRFWGDLDDLKELAQLMKDKPNLAKIIIDN